MCLVLCGYQVHTKYPLLILANRDEALSRPTQALHVWPGTQVEAGKDLSAGGTWFGCVKTRWGLVTNGPTPKKVGAKSRGLIVPKYLQSKQTPQNFAMYLKENLSKYSDCHVLWGDGQSVWYADRNVQHALVPGWYALANMPLSQQDNKAQALLAQVQAMPLSVSLDKLWTIMKNPQRTGEERRSSFFITHYQGYGTRSHTQYTIDLEGKHAIYASDVRQA